MRQGWLGLPAIVALLFVVARLLTADEDGGAAAAGPSVETLVYGDAPSEFGRLHLPAGHASGAEPAPVVVLLHGGFWRRGGGDLSLMEPLAADLAERGVAVWNVEYGRTGERFGGWPHTFNHVSAAVDHLAEIAERVPLDLDDVSVVGHSAGGHLALWVAGRDGFAARSAWDDEVVRSVPEVGVDQVVALAPIANLQAAATVGLGNGAVIDLLGGDPSEVPLRYVVAAPLPGPDVAVLVVTGSLDDIVPEVYTRGSWPDASKVFGATVDEDHLRLIAPESAGWRVAKDWLGIRE